VNRWIRGCDGAPEREARQHIDAALEAAGWAIQDRATMNLTAAPGIAVREFKMAPGHGFADYLLFVNGKAVGAPASRPGSSTASIRTPRRGRSPPTRLNFCDPVFSPTGQTTATYTEVTTVGSSFFLKVTVMSAGRTASSIKMVGGFQVC
jgi:hypothetical protein